MGGGELAQPRAFLPAVIHQEDRPSVTPSWHASAKQKPDAFVDKDFVDKDFPRKTYTQHDTMN